jgi:hypothetical protein
MITTMLQGGMSNQQFQYAMGYARAKDLGVELELDITLLQNDRMRKYSMGLWAGVKENLTFGKRSTVNERQMPYDIDLVTDIKDGDVLRGYFQDERYFKQYRKELLEIFRPKQMLSDRGFETVKKIYQKGHQSTFLTVRRTDYLNSDYHGVLDMAYYLEACRIVAEHVPPYFFVFSDEPEWCKKNFQIPYPFEVVGTYDQTNHDHLGREDEDLWLMSRCKNAVLANSSFSFWGAWMSPYDTENRMVVGPKKWFANAPGVDSSEVIPKRWTAI